MHYRIDTPKTYCHPQLVLHKRSSVLILLKHENEDISGSALGTFFATCTFDFIANMGISERIPYEQNVRSLKGKSKPPKQCAPEISVLIVVSLSKHQFSAISAGNVLGDTTMNLKQRGRSLPNFVVIVVRSHSHKRLITGFERPLYEKIKVSRKNIEPMKIWKNEHSAGWV